MAKNKFLIGFAPSSSKSRKKALDLIDNLVACGFKIKREKIVDATAYFLIDPYNKSIIPYQRVASSTITKRAHIQIDYDKYSSLKALAIMIFMISSGVNFESTPSGSRISIVDEPKLDVIDALATGESGYGYFVRNINYLGVTTRVLNIDSYKITESAVQKMFACGIDDLFKHIAADDKTCNKGKMVRVSEGDIVRSVNQNLLSQMCDLSLNNMYREFDQHYYALKKNNPVENYCEENLRNNEVSFELFGQKYSITKKGVLLKK